MVKIPSGLKHILVFGQARQGKSSLINMMIGKDQAIVNDRVVGCSFSTEPYWNDEYCFWDTAGLNEQNQGTVNDKEAAKQLISFLKFSKGFHAAVMVVSVQNMSNEATKKNYDIFYNTVLESKIPIIIALTGRDSMFSSKDEKWLETQRPLIGKLGYDSKNLCIVYNNKISGIEDMDTEDQEKLTVLTNLSKEKMILTLKNNNLQQFFRCPELSSKNFEVINQYLQTILSKVLMIMGSVVMVSVKMKLSEFLCEKLHFEKQDVEDVMKIFL